MTYKPKTTPMKHQLEYARKLRTRPDEPADEDVMALLAEMGTGKSAMILYEWQEAVDLGELDDLMVIAPAGSYRNWFDSKSDEQLSELETHLDSRLLKRLSVAAWVTGGGATRRRELEKVVATTSGGPRALFMNVEALSTVEEAEEIAVKFLSQRRAMLVIDESTRIKSGKAARTKVIVKRLMPLARARRILTGWVTPKSPLDLYWQFYFLDWRILGYETPLGFRNRYAVTERRCFLPNEVIRAKLRSSMGFKQGENRLPEPHLRHKLTLIREHLDQDHSQVATMKRDILLRKLTDETEQMSRDDMLQLIPQMGGYIQVVEKVKSYQNLEELQKKIAPYSHRVLKADCLDLAKKIYSPRDVELTAEQRRVYEGMKQYAIAEIEDEFVSATSVVTQMIRLHQIVCGHVVTEDGNVRDVESRRVQEILNVLEEHQGKAIVWATYQHEIRKIAAAIKETYGPRSTAIFYGGNRRGRVEDEKKFLGTPECRFMVSTQSAGGVGNNWVVADLVIYAANSYDLELRVQSEDRAHRKGQTRAVTYVDLITRGTVEEKIIHALRNKIDLTTAITGENFREWLI